MKVSNIKKIRKQDDDSDDEDSDSEDEADVDDASPTVAGTRPLFTCHGINHLGGINRVRVRAVLCLSSALRVSRHPPWHRAFVLEVRLRIPVYRPAFQAESEGKIVATWSETGCVHIWDVAKHVAALEGVRLSLIYLFARATLVICHTFCPIRLSTSIICSLACRFVSICLRAFPRPSGCHINVPNS